MSNDTEARFERLFEGTWKRRWWCPGSVDLVRIDTYDAGKITGGIVAVHGVTEDGWDVKFSVTPKDTRITGFKRLSNGDNEDRT